MLAVFLNLIKLWYLPKSNFLFGRSRNLKSKNRTLLEDPGPPLANNEDGAICNNSLWLKAEY